MQITIDERDGSGKSNLKTIHAEWSDVVDAIRRLNGKSHTEVTLAEGGDGPYIMIGGGPTRYFVFIWTADERSLILTDPRKGDAVERLIVGGQAAEHPSRQIVTIEDATMAAKTFFNTRLPDQELFWAEE
jgi:hypothetical protein